MAKISMRLQGDLINLDLFVIWLAERGMELEHHFDRAAKRPQDGNTLRYMTLNVTKLKEKQHG